MRQGPNPRRPRSRGNGKRHPSSKNSTVESNSPDGKVRGTAQQVYDKYLAMARDALSSGDRVTAETYSQYADHYYRVIQSSREEGGQQQPVPDQSGGGQNPGNAGRDERQHGDNQNFRRNRNPRGVPVAEMQGQNAIDDDDDTQPIGLDNAGNDPARSAY